jgi:CubicO group peptidase (beta-lactamase class C family)
MLTCFLIMGSLEDHAMKVLAPACALLLSVASPLRCQAQPTAARESKPDFSKVRQFIQEQLVATSIPSISVAVARRGKILWEEGFGWADRENRVPATEHAMYQTASVTKLMTSTAVMILQERKQLDLMGAPARTLPEIRSLLFGRRVEVKHGIVEQAEVSASTVAVRLPEDRHERLR